MLPGRCFKARLDHQHEKLIAVQSTSLKAQLNGRVLLATQPRVIDYLNWLWSLGILRGVSDLVNQDHASDHEQLAEVGVMLQAPSFVKGVGVLRRLEMFVAGKLPWPKLFTGTLATRVTGHSSRKRGCPQLKPR